MTNNLKEKTIEFQDANGDTIRITTKEGVGALIFESGNVTTQVRIIGFYSVTNDGPFLNLQVEFGHQCHHFSGDLKLDNPISLETFGDEFIFPVFKEVLLGIDSLKDEFLAEIYNKISVRYCMFMHKHGNQGYEMYTHHKIEDPLGWGWNID